jgi:hypothetical protein
VSGEITDRLYAAARTGTTPEETTRAVCREISAWLAEEAVLFTARAGTTRRGLRQLSNGDQAHRDVIDQMADVLSRVGDERWPA